MTIHVNSRNNLVRGRPKGATGRFTNLKQSFLNAYQAEDGFGGDEALKKYAKTNPESFLQMIAKLLPKDISATIDAKCKPPDVYLIVGDERRKI